MKYHSLILLALLVFAVGCGNRQVGAGGIVVFSDDGSPVMQGSALTQGTVFFSTSTFQSRSEIDSQGRFTMGSFGATDGLPPGTYNVSVVATDNTDSMNPYSLIDPKYASPVTSGIEITVDKTVRNLEIRVDRNPNPRPAAR